MNWLEELKIGDEVVVVSDVSTTKFIGRVEAITANHDYLWLEGEPFGFDSSGRCREIPDFHLLQITSKILDEMVFTEIRHNLEDQCDQIDWRELSIEQMQAIIRIANKQ